VLLISSEYEDVMQYAELIAYDDRVARQFADYRAAIRSAPAIDGRRIDISGVVQMLNAALDARTPLSVIRSGDGEGACLFHAFDGLPDLKRAVLARTLGLHFGSQAYTGEDFAFWSGEMRRAMFGADIVTAARNQATMNRLLAEDTVDYRGHVGATYGNVFVAENAYRLGSIYEDGYLHRALLARYADIFGGREVVLVTCHQPVSEPFAARFNCRVVSVVDIPNQALNANGRLSVPLYPDLYEAKRQEIISHSMPGRLVVVAAGLAAKPYCVDAAGAGAVALDVGSMMDVWAGIGVRGYQTDEFVAQHRL
jgi:hypothetical protein